METTSASWSGKPRKAKKETLSYLESFLSNPDKAGASNVMRELRYEAASVAADKDGSALLQALARLVSKRWIERLCSWCLPYGAFLAKHRHSSHVLETLIALLFSVDGRPEEEEEEEEQEEEEEEQELTSGVDFPEVLWQALVEDAGSMVDVLQDWNSSHVARACFCGMAGLPVVTERRSRRGDRHAHSIDDALFLDDDELSRRASNGEALGKLSNELVESSSSETLQRLCVSKSGAPSVALMLRILKLTSVSIDSFANKTLEVESKERCRDVVFGLSFDPSGSIVMEAFLKYCSDDAVDSYVKVMDFKALIDGQTSNYVAQAALRRNSSRELCEKIVKEAPGLFKRPDRVGVLSALLENAPLSSASLFPAIEWNVVLCDERKGALREHGARAAVASLKLDRARTLDALKVCADRLYIILRDHKLPWNRALFDSLATDKRGAKLLASHLIKQPNLLFEVLKSPLLLRLFRAVDPSLKTSMLEPLVDSEASRNRVPRYFVKNVDLELFASDRAQWLASFSDKKVPSSSSKATKQRDAERRENKRRPFVDEDDLVEGGEMEPTSAAKKKTTALSLKEKRKLKRRRSHHS